MKSKRSKKKMKLWKEKSKLEGKERKKEKKKGRRTWQGAVGPGHVISRLGIAFKGSS